MQDHFQQPVLLGIDAFHLLNQTLRRYRIEPVDWKFFWENPSTSLREVIKTILTKKESPAEFIATMIDEGLNRDSITREYASYHFGQGYPHQIEKALEKHSPTATRHFSHYLLKRLFANYTLIESILDAKGRYQGSEHRIKHKLVIDARASYSDPKRETHFKRVVEFASLDDAVALAEAYESHPKVQGAAIFCVSDWTHEDPTDTESWDIREKIRTEYESSRRFQVLCRSSYQAEKSIKEDQDRLYQQARGVHAAKHVATALRKLIVSEFAKICADANLNPTVSLHCLAEISRYHQDEEAVNFAIQAVREYIPIPNQDPKTALPEIILSYLADTFRISLDPSFLFDYGPSRRKASFRLRSHGQKEQDETATFYEAGQMLDKLIATYTGR